MKIIVDYRDLDKKGDILIEKADDFKIYINQMSNQMEKLGRFWNTDESHEFQNDIKEGYISTFLKLQDILLDYGNYLKDVSKAYQNLDNIFSSKRINTNSRYR